MAHTHKSAIKVLEHEFGLDGIVPVSVRLLKELSDEADKWHNNHDGLKRINAILRDRPDLKDRAARMDELLKEVESLKKQLKSKVDVW